MALLDEVAVLALILLALWYFNIDLSLPLIIIIAVSLGAMAFITHRAVVPSLHKKKTAGAEAMEGAEGTVVEPLTPLGAVWVAGEYWKAESVDGDIIAGEEVEVVRICRLRLEVKRKGREGLWRWLINTSPDIRRCIGAANSGAGLKPWRRGSTAAIYAPGNAASTACAVKRAFAAPGYCR